MPAKRGYKQQSGYKPKTKTPKMKKAKKMTASTYMEAMKVAKGKW